MKKTIGMVIKTLLVLIVVLWIGLIMIEFVRFKNNEPMLVVLNEKILNYDDGHVYVYYGLGYKAIDYERTSIYGKQFGHMFIKVKEYIEQK